MDGLIDAPKDTRPMNGREAMPPPAPLAFEVQNLRGAIEVETTLAGSPPRFWRSMIFGSTLLTTLVLVFLLARYFAQDSLSGLEAILLLIVGVTFAWIALSVATIAAALLNRLARPQTPSETKAPEGADTLTTALLVPIYNESPSDVFGNAAAMLADLARQGTANSFALFILSDTRDEALAEQEWRAFDWLREQAPKGIAVHYRRRLENTDKKIGNLAQWIRGWGAGYDAMLVLDADSLMSGRAIRELSEALARDPSAGLIQSFPALIGAESLFGRIQQFSNATYSWLLSEGLALWTQNEGNYWGHNAILRTCAFAGSAGLPHLPSKNGTGRMILSHDFVEAGLLRRKGWAVRFLPVRGSFEETPATLVDYILRDQRWCQGNLQHLRLITTRGFHLITRFHLLFGAIGYLMSPAWLFLLIVWAALDLSDMAPLHYFSEANPLYPLWPEMSTSHATAFLLFMYGMLLLPKLSASLMIALTPRGRRRYGGGWSFMAGVLLEVLASILYAPVMMVQQSLAVSRAARGRQATWAPQRRTAARIPFGQLARFHALETGFGLVLMGLLLSGLVSLWLLPIAISLALAVPLSALSALDVSRLRLKAGRLETPQSLQAPPIWNKAQKARAELRRHLQSSEIVAAE